jgi:protein farnesyltransferase/geranylgeranyltransferase type-1 subunit alpha
LLLPRRALSLTADVIEQNSANYTAWSYRRACLVALQSSVDAELQYCERIARQTPKNYQLWHHRRSLISRRQQPGNELQHTEDVLQIDAKNYHVWAHRSLQHT